MLLALQAVRPRNVPFLSKGPGGMLFIQYNLLSNDRIVAGATIDIRLGHSNKFKVKHLSKAVCQN